MAWTRQHESSPFTPVLLRERDDRTGICNLSAYSRHQGRRRALAEIRVDADVFSAAATRGDSAKHAGRKSHDPGTDAREMAGTALGAGDPQDTGQADILNGMKQTQDLLAKLTGVRPAGEGRWFARCPAHDDSSPSLSIRDTGETILLNCFAGCNATDVLSAIGMEWKDIYPDRWTCAKNRPNEGADRYTRRTMAHFDPLDVEQWVLKIADADLAAGKELNGFDRARVEVAKERVIAGRQA